MMWGEGQQPLKSFCSLVHQAEIKALSILKVYEKCTPLNYLSSQQDGEGDKLDGGNIREAGVLILSQPYITCQVVLELPSLSASYL